MSNFHYLLSKMISHFLALAVMAGALELAFVAMQYIRREETQWVLRDYLFPYVWIVLPSLCVLAALTLLFDTDPFDERRHREYRFLQYMDSDQCFKFFRGWEDRYLWFSINLH